MSNFPPPGSPQQQPYPIQPGYPPGSEPYPPPRQGMGCGLKILIALGVCFVLMAIVCCGSFYMAGRSFKPVTAAKDVDALTKEIADIDIPARLEPVMGMNMQVPFVNKTLMKFVLYSDKNSSEDKASNLTLIAMGDLLAGQNQEQVQQSFNESFSKSTGRQNKQQETLQDEKRSTKERTIRGQKVTFTIVKGTGSTSKVPRIRVQATFPGKTGMVMLILDANAETLPQTDVEEMIDSIK